MDQIPMHLGVSHFSTPAVAVEGLQEALLQNDTFYGPTEGTMSLRQAVAKRYLEEDGIPLPESQVLITAGAKHAIHLYLQSLLQPQDQVVMLAPYWFAFPDLISLSGGELVSIPANPQEGYALPLEALKAAITPQTKLLILSNPGNPTGKVYTQEELQKVAHLLEEHPNLHVLSDEIYDGLQYETPPFSMLRFEHLRDRISVVNGFSKSFAMSGWRVGYLIAPFEILERATALQLKTISGVSPLTQAAAVQAMEHRQQIWQSFKEDLAPKRQRVQEALAQIPALSYTTPDAGYYFTLDVSACLQEMNSNSLYKTVEEWASGLKNQVGLEVLPATNMGMPGAVRMSFALPDHILESALLRLKAFVI
ncbi:aminotransferase class I/II-fold pyridoxal phosphate-dependent enzyme [Nibribacter ruber]|uniref:Aminotransferase n=1 Tax=Nibribacter ruber TaxID=2698458 RepID=A0A6P1NRA1_9BACT|nr:aminotransferase class I/II-fold pyridoxal phosphate-dependent enzyme [Nibribacter ruber]QHL86207.1 aminotransferase class I/II-fold pyridoxal phosphate-dependent enzyme [Nibribacter ruber]